MDLEERWVEVPDYPTYQVSTHGRVRNVKARRHLTPSANSEGHLRVTLSREGVMRQFYIRRLVAQAFLPNYREGAIVKNVNGDLTDNSVKNVYVRGYDTIPIRRRRQGPWGKPVQIVETAEVFKSARDLARYIGGDFTSVYKVLRGERRSHMGYTFRYYEDL